MKLFSAMAGMKRRRSWQFTLNKSDLKAFSQLRTTDGKPFHTIVARGNAGTIDGIPYIINSVLPALSASATAAGTYCMAYGSLSNYRLVVLGS